MLCVILLWEPAMLMADSLELKSGRVITGRVIGETADSVTFQNNEGRFTFPKNRIKQIFKEPASRNILNDVGDLLAAGQLEPALQLYDKAGLTDEFAPGTFQALLLEKMKHSAGTAVCTSSTAAKITERLALSIDSTHELLLFGSTLAAEMQEYDTALKLLRRIHQPLARSSVWPSSTLSLLLNRIAQSASRDNRGDLIAAAGSLSTILLDPGVRQSDPLRLYAEIESLRVSGDYLKATTLFYPDLFLHRADLFRPLAERLLGSMLAAPSTPQSLAALESAQIVLFPHVSSRLRENAIRTLISRLAAGSRLEDARRIADNFASSWPEEAAPAVHLVEFHQRHNNVPPHSTIEKYKLASWARSMGLLEEAASLFQELSKDARFSANAGLQLELIRTAQCSRELDYLRQHYDNNEFTQLESGVHSFLNTSPPDAFAQKARDLVQLAKFQKWSGGKTVPEKTEAELQQAERLALRRDYDAALLHLNRIQMEVGDATARSRARDLKDKIMRARALEQAQGTTSSRVSRSLPGHR